MPQLNTQSYRSMINALSGGKKGKRGSKISRRRRSQNRNRNNSRNQNQTGGFFPGIGEVVSQAIVPFGLYAAQHKFKSKSAKFRNPSNYSFKQMKKFKFTRKL